MPKKGEDPQQLEQQKKDKATNSAYLHQVFGKENIQNFFRDKKVNSQTMKELYAKYNKQQEYGKLFGDIVFGKTDQEMIKGVEKMGPFSDELDLVRKISTYLSEHFKYDYIMCIPVVDSIISSFFTNGISDKNQLIDSVDRLSQTHLSMSEAEKAELLKVIENKNRNQLRKHLLGLFTGKKSVTISQPQIESMKSIANNIPDYVDVQDSEKIKNFVSNLPSDNVTSYLTANLGTIQEIYNIQENISSLSQTGNTLMMTKPIGANELLERYKVGVCRHFSRLMQVLYEKNQSKILTKHGNSNMIVVSNKQYEHSYNMLRLQNGTQVEEKYIDFTDYLFGGSLLKEKDMKKYGSEVELWTKNTLQTNNGSDGQQYS